MLATLFRLPTLTCQQVATLLAERRAIAIDVNAPASWQRAHLPGAVLAGPPPVAAHALAAHRATTLVFYCANPLCSKAPRAARQARALGFDARVMPAGISGWLAAGLPFEQQAASR